MTPQATGDTVATDIASDHNDFDDIFFRLTRRMSFLIAVALSLFVLIEVNFSILTPLKQLSLFVTAGLVLCFLQIPIHPRLRHVRAFQVMDLILALLAVGCCLYLIYQGATLGQRAAIYSTADQVVGAIGLILVIEAARRSVGLALPILALDFCRLRASKCFAVAPRMDVSAPRTRLGRLDRSDLPAYRRCIRHRRWRHVPLRFPVRPVWRIFAG